MFHETGSFYEDELSKVFNIGIGLIAIVDKKEIDGILRTASEVGETGFVLGEIKN